MLYLLVQVYESAKCIVERVISIESTNNQFSDLFDAITLGQYDDKEVKVFVRQEKSESWKEVDNGLESDLKMLEILGYLQVKFCLINNMISDIPVSPDKPNAFNILMNNSHQPLLPQHCTEHNNYNRLYNEIIDLFHDKKVGWTGGMHNTIGKTL